MSRLLSKFAELSRATESEARGLLFHSARVAEQAARAGGRVLLNRMGRTHVREKGPKDLVTEADTTSQRVIREILLNACPDYEFAGEEDDEAVCWPLTGAGLSNIESAPMRWIVDPLDGTANYVKGLPGYAVSIGLERGGEVLAGVVFDPRLDECFVATLGSGAFLNGQPLQVSRCGNLPGAMVVASFPPNVSRSSPDIPRFENLLATCHSLRRLGSAALNLCYLAAGRLDAYWATSCKPWDVAAGVLMITEAGGIVTNLDGWRFELFAPVFAASANSTLQGQFLQILGLTAVAKS